jgi:Fe2+ transport system protein FeoA
MWKTGNLHLFSISGYGDRRMTLNMAAPNQDLRVVAIEGGLRMKQRLADLGLNQGVTIRILNDSGHGALILAVKDSRLAIGRGMANKILVEPLSAA